MLEVGVSQAWASRAAAWAIKYPEHVLGVRAGFVGSVPCDGLAAPVQVMGVDVPAAGNCIYHAVWTAAGFAGVPLPFGMAGSEHVYKLRVAVAEVVKELVDTSCIEDCFRVGSLRIEDLVATPDQWLEYSGQVPLIAMATMLKREIVTLCADGLFTITSSAISGDPAQRPPVVIYNCTAGQVNARASLSVRNHHIAVFFR